MPTTVTSLPINGFLRKWRKQLLVLFIVIVAMGGCKPTHSSHSEEVKVYVLDGGFMKVNDLTYFTMDTAYQGDSITLDNPVFLIQHPKGRLLWDTGLGDSIAHLPEVDTFWISFHVRTPLIDQLAEMDLTPDSIDLVAVSHTHLDHFGNAKYFENSTWIVDSLELAWSTRESNARNHNYLAFLRSAKKRFFKDMNDVFSDGRVMIYSFPGHTPGHACLLVRLQNRTLLLSGDLYHFEEQRRYRRVPRFNTNAEMTQNSMYRFEQLADSLNAEVIIQHDRDHYKKLPAYPAYLF